MDITEKLLEPRYVYVSETQNTVTVLPQKRDFEAVEEIKKLRQMVMESNELKLKRLRAELNEADWEGDTTRADAIRHEMARLELMLSVGTHYDEPF